VRAGDDILFRSSVPDHEGGRVADGVDGGRSAVVLDHVAVGTSQLSDGWDLFGGLLGGAWAYGGNSPGFWWGQLRFSAGPKVELLTPTGGADSAFLEQFLASRGPGFHHLNFIVPDIAVTLGTMAALGMEPVGVRLENPAWKEAFLRPRDAFGTVVQVAEQAGPPMVTPPPAGLAEPGPSCALSVVEQHVSDVDGATCLFREVLGGEVASRYDATEGAVAELLWPNGARLRLVQPAVDRPGTEQSAEGIAHLQFSRDEGAFGAADHEAAAVLARRLGVSVRLSG
jgi:methylmalonyl-CoA/ethylmalonyl-CoA epimerase